MKKEWYLIDNADDFDTPFLAVYPDRVKTNIELALRMVGNDPSRLRPHMKTHKMAEIVELFLSYGITKAKCATIAEAELAALAGMKDILLAYQAVGAKRDRFLRLMEAYPDVFFSCIVDDALSATLLAKVAVSLRKKINAYLDLNTGMNRTGYFYRENVSRFYQSIYAIEGLNLMGLHIYDGHLRAANPEQRSEAAKEALDYIVEEINTIESLGMPRPLIVAGGSNTFSFYAKKNDIECSPGTFVFWDAGYKAMLPELDFLYAAALVAKVISKPFPDLLCLDLGYKSVASENPIEKRIMFPWNSGLLVQSHSEEHLVVKNETDIAYPIGTLLYGIPYHICPSCALYEEAQIVRDHRITSQWKVAARARKISI